MADRVLPGHSAVVGAQEYFLVNEWGESRYASVCKHSSLLLVFFTMSRGGDGATSCGYVAGNKLRDFPRMCRQVPVLKVRERSPPPS